MNQLNEALFEVAHLVADPTRVDGTVIGEIAASCPKFCEWRGRTTSKARN